MANDTFERAKKYVYELVGYNERVPFYVLTRDSCSEISRLVGYRLRKEFPRAKICICKGKVRGHSHDVLLVEENQVYVIDPTVWQFSRYKKSILVAKADSTDGAIATLMRHYGGKWRVSEHIHNYSAVEIKRLKCVIRDNIAY